MPNPQSENRFLCKHCGESFIVPEAALKKYPGWKPSQCMRCRDQNKVNQSKTTGSSAPFTKGAREKTSHNSASTLFRGQNKNIEPQCLSSEHVEEQDTPPSVISPPMTAAFQAMLASVLEKYSAGPTEGIFTDGACSGNPGPGGWGVVYVRNNRIVTQSFGQEAPTTNNRMELTALITGFSLIDRPEPITIWSDSDLCVKTITLWAKQWEKNGWRRKTGEIKNLDLVKTVYRLAQKHPQAKLCWVKAHNGNRWNEYVDTLSNNFLYNRD